MNAAFILVLLGGCVSVSYSQTTNGQTTCSETERPRLQQCVDMYHMTVNTSNMQDKCQVARTLLECFYNQDNCVWYFGFQDTVTQARNIQDNYPCNDVMSASGRTAVVYMSTMLFAALAAMSL